MSKFRKKPVVIEAIQWDGKNVREIQDFISRDNIAYKPHPVNEIYIPTLEGVMTASKGDWIICGVKGEFYPCKPDIFEATYEPA